MTPEQTRARHAELTNQLAAQKREVQARHAVLKRRIRAQELAALDESETNLINKYDMEQRLGGRLNEGKEIQDWVLQSNILRYEDAGDALKYANESGRLPEGAKAYGITHPSGSPELVYKNPGSDEFNYINDPGPSKADVGKFAGQLASLESLSVLAPMPQGKLRALSRFPRAARAGWESLMASSGRIGDEIAEGLIVDNVDPVDTLLKEAATSGALSFPLSYAGQPISTSKLTADRTVPPAQVKEVFEAETRQAYPPLGAGELGSPIGARIQAQAAGVDTRSAARELEKLRAPARRLIAEAAGVENADALDDAALLAVIGREERVGRKLLEKMLGDKGFFFRSTSAEKGGRAIYDTIDAYRTATSIQGTKNYGRIFDIAEEEGVVFDVAGVKAAARDATEKARLLAEGSPPEAPSFTDRATGFKPPGTGPSMKEIPTLLDPQLERVLGDLTNLVDTQPTEALRGLRTTATRLRGLADPAPGSVTRTPSQKAANDVLMAINEAVNKTPGSERYQAAVKAANSHWKSRSQNLNAFGFMEDMQDSLGGGERMYRRLVSGDMPASVAQFVKKNMSNQQENNFLKAFYTDMLRNPDKIAPTLKSMDVAGHILIPKQHRQVLNNFGREVAKSNSGLLGKLVMQTTDDAHRFWSILESGSPSDIVRLKRGGVMTARQSKEAVFYKFVQDSTKFEDGQHVLDPKKYEHAYNKFKKEGWLEFLDTNQKGILKDTRLYGSYLKTGSDAGNSLQAAQLTSTMARALTGPISAIEAKADVFQLSLLARLSHSVPVRAALAGGTFKTEDHRWARAAILAGTLYLRRAAGEPEVEKESPVYSPPAALPYGP